MVELKPSLSLLSQELPPSPPLPSSPEAALLWSALRSPLGRGPAHLPFGGPGKPAPVGPLLAAKTGQGDATVPTPAPRAGELDPASLPWRPVNPGRSLPISRVRRAAGVGSADLPRAGRVPETPPLRTVPPHPWLRSGSEFYSSSLSLKPSLSGSACVRGPGSADCCLGISRACGPDVRSTEGFILRPLQAHREGRCAGRADP